MKKIIYTSILFIGLFVTNTQALAADNITPRIYFKGPTAALAPNSDVSISVLLDSGYPINALDVEIKFPKDKLKYLDFDNTGSLIDLWQSKPEILPDGNLGFSGGIINSFQGSAGLVGKISFKVLASGAPDLSFAKSDVYFADGKGTKMTANTSHLTLAVKEDGQVVSTTPVPFQNTPTDVEVAQGLQTFKTHQIWKNVFIPVLVLIIFVIVCFLVYNKRRVR